MSTGMVHTYRSPDTRSGLTVLTPFMKAHAEATQKLFVLYRFLSSEPRIVSPSYAETKFRQPRANGSHVQHLRNSCVLLSEKGAPLGNRIKGCLGFEFNKPRWRKLGLLSKRLF